MRNFASKQRNQNNERAPKLRIFFLRLSGFFYLKTEKRRNNICDAGNTRFVFFWYFHCVPSNKYENTQTITFRISFDTHLDDLKRHRLSAKQ